MAPLTSTATKIKPLRLAIVGAGAMGTNHLRVARACAEVHVAFVIDAALDRARAATAGTDAREAAAVEDAVGAIDAAVIAAPTAVHAALAVPLLRAGIHCLVEKPFAPSQPECRAMIEAAAAGGAVLQVGHVERFNPAVEALMAENIDAAWIRMLGARRMNAASGRVVDIDVVLDLMVHDLDVALALKAMPVIDVDATGDKDHALAELTFSDGCRATVTASRTTPGRTRDLTLSTEEARYQLDYIAREVKRDGTSLPVQAGDALANQLSDFVRCIRERAPPRVSGLQALAVMDVAWRVQDALGLRS